MGWIPPGIGPERPGVSAGNRLGDVRLEAKGLHLYDWQCRWSNRRRIPGGASTSSSGVPARIQTTGLLVYATQRQACALETLVRVIGTRWYIKRAFKDAVGLDKHEVRSATGWYRHMMLALWALVLLPVLRPTTPLVVGTAHVAVDRHALPA